MRGWFIGLILTLSAACALAQSPMGGITAPGTRTYTSQQTLGSGCAASTTPFGFHKWFAQSFTTSGAYTATRIDLGLHIQAGSPFSSAVTGYIYSSSAGAPGSALQTASPTETYSLTGSTINYPWYFSGQSLSGTTQYFAVIAAPSTDSTNEGLWCGATGGSEHYYYSDDGSTWTLQATGQLIVNTYSSP